MMWRYLKDVFHLAEREYSSYNFENADVDALFDNFNC